MYFWHTHCVLLTATIALGMIFLHCLQTRRRDGAEASRRGSMLKGSKSCLGDPGLPGAAKAACCWCRQERRGTAEENETVRKNLAFPGPSCGGRGCSGHKRCRPCKTGKVVRQKRDVKAAASRGGVETQAASSMLQIKFCTQSFAHPPLVCGLIVSATQDHSPSFARATTSLRDAPSPAASRIR